MNNLDRNVFPDEIELKDLGMYRGSRRFELLRDFRFLFKGYNIKVPKGFVTDGISSPKIFWPIIGPFGEAFPAAIVHDWCYSAHNPDFGFLESNYIFIEGMKASNVSLFKRWFIYLGVILFSYPLWVNRSRNRYEI
jgi:hypothetical protein